MAHCECFDKGVWHALPSLPDPITKTGIVERKNVLYASGWPSEKIFTFDIAQNEWGVLKVLIPAPFNSVLVISENFLYVFRGAATGSKFCKIDLENEYETDC
jgi:hypothetical protein